VGIHEVPTHRIYAVGGLRSAHTSHVIRSAQSSEQYFFVSNSGSAVWGLEKLGVAFRHSHAHPSFWQVMRSVRSFLAQAIEQYFRALAGDSLRVRPRGQGTLYMVSLAQPGVPQVGRAVDMMGKSLEKLRFGWS
jgi:hypothetical protein